MAATTGGPSPAAPSPASSNGLGPKGVVPAEWPAQAADTIVETIGKVRDKTTRPAIVAARAVVYGLLAVIVGSVAVVLLLVLTVRLWGNYFPGKIWLLYALLFAVMTPGGLVLLKRANRPADPTS